MCEPTKSFEAWNVFKCFCNAWHSKEGAGRGKEHFAAVMSPCGLCLRSQYRLKEIYFQSFPQQVPRHTLLVANRHTKGSQLSNFCTLIQSPALIDPLKITFSMISTALSTNV